VQAASHSACAPFAAESSVSAAIIANVDPIPHRPRKTCFTCAQGLREWLGDTVPPRTSKNVVNPNRREAALTNRSEIMCQRIDCKRGGRPSVMGCGRHVDAVLADVPPAARCHCREGTTHAAPPPERGRTLLSKLLGALGRRRA